MPVTSPVAQAGVTWVPVYLTNTFYDFLGATENIVLMGHLALMLPGAQRALVHYCNFIYSQKIQTGNTIFAFTLK